VTLVLLSRKIIEIADLNRILIRMCAFRNKIRKNLVMKHVAKWLFFFTRHVGPLIDTRGPIVMSSAKKTLILQLVA
jgi:hypothetical protein